MEDKSNHQLSRPQAEHHAAQGVTITPVSQAHMGEQNGNELKRKSGDHDQMREDAREEPGIRSQPQSELYGDKQAGENKIEEQSMLSKDARSESDPSSSIPRTDSDIDTIEEEKALRVSSIVTPLPSHTKSPQRTNSSAKLCSNNTPTQPVTFTRSEEGVYISSNNYRLKNSLLAAIGFLELANAGDFAANVWNTIPVPTFAAVLMGLGGAFALFISIFAFWDAVLARRNYIALKDERQVLKSFEQGGSQNQKLYTEIDTHLDVNHRERGTELVDRIGMDLFMGFGSVMVGVGTLMAIGGANPKVFHASNLLSGYIGNSPVALFGLFNAGWSVFVFRRAHRHRNAAATPLQGEEQVLHLLRRRARRVETHATILGSVGIIAGGASLVTAEHWEGYPILIPCIISSWFCNWIFRTRIGYDRVLISQLPGISVASLVEELKFVTSIQHIFKTTKPELVFREVVPESEFINSVLNFLVEWDMFEEFCNRLLLNATLSTAVFGGLREVVAISPEILLEAKNKEVFSDLAKLAETTMKEIGKEKFIYRERYLLEVLGALLHHQGEEEKRLGKKVGIVGSEKDGSTSQ